MQTVNRAVRTMKAILFFTVERELTERNVLQRFRPFEGGKDERHAQRGTFTEDELRRMLTVAKPTERVLVKLLVLTGLRTGECFGLGWEDVDLDAGCLHVRRSWDFKGKAFNEPKTKAGHRTVPLDGRLVAELRAYRRDRTGGLVFSTRTGQPLNPSNVRRDTWIPLLKRAGVPYRDLYSLRSTFATLARASGEAAFNVSRAIGHSRSTLVDAVYARALQSGLSYVATAMTRSFGDSPRMRVATASLHLTAVYRRALIAAPSHSSQVIDS